MRYLFVLLVFLVGCNNKQPASSADTVTTTIKQDKIDPNELVSGNVNLIDSEEKASWSIVKSGEKLENTTFFMSIAEIEIRKGWKRSVYIRAQDTIELESYMEAIYNFCVDTTKSTKLATPFRDSAILLKVNEEGNISIGESKGNIVFSKEEGLRFVESVRDSYSYFD